MWSLQTQRATKDIFALRINISMFSVIPCFHFVFFVNFVAVYWYGNCRKMSSPRVYVAGEVKSANVWEEPTMCNEARLVGVEHSPHCKDATTVEMWCVASVNWIQYCINSLVCMVQILDAATVGSWCTASIQSFVSKDMYTTPFWIHSVKGSRE